MPCSVSFGLFQISKTKEEKMKSIVVAIGCAVASLSMFGQSVSQHPGGASAEHQRLGIVL